MKIGKVIAEMAAFGVPPSGGTFRPKRRGEEITAETQRSQRMRRESENEWKLQS
jgi:hypothetical protein